MTQIIERELVNQALDDAGLDERNLHATYSGRYMYGARCFGIIGNVRDLTKFLLALQALNDDTAEFDGGLTEALAENITQDSMGRDSIFYFPGFELEADGEETPEPSEK